MEVVEKMIVSEQTEPENFPVGLYPGRKAAA